MQPYLAALLQTRGHYIDYQLYTQAYGLEMQIDNSLDVEIVLFAPRGHLAGIVEQTGVTGQDTRIVSAGVTSVPQNKRYKPIFDEIIDRKNNWLLLGDPRSGDTVSDKLIAALKKKCRIVLYVAPRKYEETFELLKPISKSLWKQIVFAVIRDDNDINAAAIECNAVREQIMSCTGQSANRVIVSMPDVVQHAKEVVEEKSIDGILLLDDQYGDVEEIISLATLLAR